MPTVTRATFIREMASAFELSIPAAARKVTDVCKELEVTNPTRLSHHQAAEVETIIARDMKAAK
jgi:hypothetical protein